MEAVQRARATRDAATSSPAPLLATRCNECNGPMSAAACSAADIPRIPAPAAPLVVRWINMAGQTTRARIMRRQIAAAQAVLPPGFAIDIERSEAVVPTCTRRSRPCAVPSPRRRTSIPARPSRSSPRNCAGTRRSARAHIDQGSAHTTPPLHHAILRSQHERAGLLGTTSSRTRACTRASRRRPSAAVAPQLLLLEDDVEVAPRFRGAAVLARAARRPRLRRRALRLLGRVLRLRRRRQRRVPRAAALVQPDGHGVRRRARRSCPSSRAPRRRPAARVWRDAD